MNQRCLCQWPSGLERGFDLCAGFVWAAPSDSAKMPSDIGWHGRGSGLEELVHFNLKLPSEGLFYRICWLQKADSVLEWTWYHSLWIITRLAPRLISPRFAIRANCFVPLTSKKDNITPGVCGESGYKKESRKNVVHKSLDGIKLHPFIRILTIWYTFIFP